MIKICISVTSHALDPPLPPVTNCHTFSDPLPLERDVLYGQPLSLYEPEPVSEISTVSSMQSRVIYIGPTYIIFSYGHVILALYKCHGKYIGLIAIIIMIWASWPRTHAHTRARAHTQVGLL